MIQPHRRLVLAGSLGLIGGGWTPGADAGRRLAAAARAQVGVTRGYDPAYRSLAYPGGDPPRATGVCADVPVRAARDGLGLDLQQLVHEDMVSNFAAYPSRARWGLTRPDPNIDHRRVPNLEVFWTRAGTRLWRPDRPTPGDGFPVRLEPGDTLTWLLIGGFPHLGVVVQGGAEPRIVHNWGAGAQEAPLALLHGHRAMGCFRWPRGEA